MVWALTLALALVMTVSVPSYATEGEGAEETGASSPSVEYVTMDTFESHIVDVQVQNRETENVLLRQEQLLAEIRDGIEAEEGEVVEDSRTEEQLSQVIDELLAIRGSLEVPEVVAVDAVGGTRATTAFLAYANVPSSGTYWQYATQLLTKVPWGSHYVFVQDTQSSYTLVWSENLKLSAQGTFIGSNTSWVRWYYAGSGTGYVMQNGSGDVTVTPQGYVVLSDLGLYPTLGGSSELYRKEVGFYVVVAACLSSLRYVWSFLVRMRSGTEHGAG